MRFGVGQLGGRSIAQFSDVDAIVVAARARILQRDLNLTRVAETAGPCRLQDAQIQRDTVQICAGIDGQVDIAARQYEELGRRAGGKTDGQVRHRRHRGRDSGGPERQRLEVGNTAQSNLV